MGGLATLDAIKDAQPRRCPVILVTKSEEETLMDEAIGRRITDYLIKPVNPIAGLPRRASACSRPQTLQQDSQRARDYVGEMQRWQTLDTAPPRLAGLGRAGGRRGALGRARSSSSRDAGPAAGARRLPARAQPRLRPLHRGAATRAGCRRRRGERPLLSTDVVDARGGAAPEGGAGASCSSSSTACGSTSGSRSSRCSSRYFDVQRELLLLDPADRDAVLAQRDLLGPAARRDAAAPPRPVAGEQQGRAHARTASSASCSMRSWRG